MKLVARAITTTGATIRGGDLARDIRASHVKVQPMGTGKGRLLGRMNGKQGEVR